MVHKNESGAGVANVSLSYIFVRHLHLGLPGIVYGTLIAVVGRCAVWMPWSSCPSGYASSTTTPGAIRTRSGSPSSSRRV